MIKLNYRNLIVFLVLFFIEVLIATYSKPGFIRAVIGDFLVVIMLYYFFKSFIKIKPIYLAIFVLSFAYLIEFLQFIDILNILYFKGNTLLNIVLGTTFNFIDVLAYTLGVITVLLIENRFKFYFHR